MLGVQPIRLDAFPGRAARAIDERSAERRAHLDPLAAAEHEKGIAPSRIAGHRAGVDERRVVLGGGIDG